MKYYNHISKGYNELHKEEQLKKLSLIKGCIKIKKSDLLLDVGCGTGVSSDFDCKVFGVEPSFQLLRLNKNHNKIGSIAENLPFKDKIFDIVISVTAMHNFADIEKGLGEMKRVGKNKFVFSILKKSKKLGQIKKLIKKNFRINNIIEEEKDVLFFCE